MNMRQRAALTALLMFLPERRVKISRLVRIEEKLRAIRERAVIGEDKKADLRDVLLAVLDEPTGDPT